MSEQPSRSWKGVDILAHFDHLTDLVSVALASASDDAFEQTCTLTVGTKIVFSGSRYAAYRQMGINHLIHHRAQLGTYLRSLDIPLPACYGPSADEQAWRLAMFNNRGLDRWFGYRSINAIHAASLNAVR